MIKRSLLIVEDEDTARETFAAALMKGGWEVEQAKNGITAIEFLSSGRVFEVVLLDLYLPDVSGFAVIDRLREAHVQIPTVIAVSAHIDDKAWERFVGLGFSGLVPKPIDPAVLAELVNAYFDRNETALANLPELRKANLEAYAFEQDGRRAYLCRRLSDDEAPFMQRAMALNRPLDEVVSDREKSLIAFFRSRATQITPPTAAEPMLVVARRWNSWYPSFFNVDGGAYAVVGAQAETGLPPSALIDPGFKSLRILTEIGVSTASLKTCTITHNHPDHMGGVFEYVTARHVLGQTTALFCAHSVAEMLKSYAGGNLEVREFSVQDVEIIPRYPAASHTLRKVRATPVQTCHHNAGVAEGSLGIVITSEQSHDGKHFDPEASAYIMGDTEYDSSEYAANARLFQLMLLPFESEALRVAALHLGCSQYKEGTGKHLYLPGMIDLLRDIDSLRRRKIRNASKRPLLILVSEWGLEHASREQLVSAMGEPLPPDLAASFDSRNLVLETIEVLKETCKLQTVILLPADIGLVVGIESGNVYTREGRFVPAQDVIPKADEFGLHYVARDANGKSTSQTASR